MNSLSTIVRVGISDLNVVAEPNKIRTSGLGSCVGIVLYDLQKKVAGMSHIMLPDSAHTKQFELNKYKYADTAIPILIDKLSEMGARRRVLRAKIAGGSQMFNFGSTSDIMRIGPRNVEAVEKELSKHNIPIIASDTGGSWGRTIQFDPSTGKLHIRSVNKGEKFI